MNKIFTLLCTLDTTDIIVLLKLKKLMWIGPVFALILSMILAPVGLSDVYAQEKAPDKYVPDRLLIKFKKDVSNSQKNQVLSANGATELSEIKPLGIKLIKVPEHALEKVKAAFAKNSLVEYVEKDYIFEPTIIPNDPYYITQWHLEKIKAKDAWDITQGSSSIPIAILDTGVDPNHSDLKDKLVLGYNFYNNNNNWADVCTHGTKVAGTAAAITNNGLFVSGVAWNNPIIPIRITDTNCMGYYSAMINGIVYAADNGARVANISFQIFNGAGLTDAAKYMHDRGGWVVAAAGNTGIFENYSDNPYIISVGATSSSDNVSSFSSYGPYVDFAAPGSSIYTTSPGDTTGFSSGTSFSSPIVAGIVGLVISNNPSMTSQQVYDALKNSAVDKGTAGRDNYYGWGLVNAYGALLQNNPAPPPDTTPPSAPSLVAPANAAVTNDNTPTFDWTDVSDSSLPVTYEILVDNNNAFSSPEISKQSLSSSDYTQATSLTDGTYYWKVRATDGVGNTGSYSAVRTVIIDTTPIPDTTPPSAPSLVAPANAAVTNDNTPTFDWTDVSDSSLPVTYEILVDNNNAFSSPEISKQSLSSSDYTQATSLTDGTYYWKVRATDGVGNTGSYSAVRTVIIDTIPVDTTPPTITITNPVDDTTVSELITVSAVATDNVEVSSVDLYVNNVFYAKKTSNPYDFTVDTKDLLTGSNKLMAKAFDTSNNSNEDTVNVLVAEIEKESSIIITSPENGAQVNGKITISTQIYNIPNISSVKFFIDGSLKGIVSAEPYQFGWHTKGESAGDHTITVEASDTNSNTVSSSITVQIPSKQGKPKNVGPQEVDFEQQTGILEDETGTSSETIKTSLEEPSKIKESILTSETPDFVPIVPQVVAEGSLLLIDISTSNSEGNNFSFPQEDQDIPAFSKLMDNSDGTATLKIIPEFEDAGDYILVISAKDDGVPPSSSSITILLTVTEGTPESVIQYLQNLKSNLGSEDIKNLGEKVSNAAQLHKYLTEATKQERSDFQDLFHEYIKDTKNLLGIAQTAEEKLIIQDITKTEIRVDHALEKLDIKEDHENKVKDTMMLIEKRKELADTINQIIALEHFIKEKSEKEKPIEELTAKKLVLMKEVMIEEAKQSNVELSDDDVKKIVEKIDQSSQSQSSQTKSTGQDNAGTKSNNGQGNGSSNKSNGNDKSNNGKSGNDKSNK